MEEAIGYEALFSAEEWDAIRSGEWSGTDDWGSPQEGASETKHSVFVGYPPGTYEGDEERYELECDVCDYIGAADNLDEAETQARLHEVLKATEVQA